MPCIIEVLITNQRSDKKVLHSERWAIFSWIDFAHIVILMSKIATPLIHALLWDAQCYLGFFDAPRAFFRCCAFDTVDSIGNVLYVTSKKAQCSTNLEPYFVLDDLNWITCIKS